MAVMWKLAQTSPGGNPMPARTAKKLFSLTRPTRRTHPGMRLLPIALLALAGVGHADASDRAADQARWQREARAVTITRDDWGT